MAVSTTSTTLSSSDPAFLSACYRHHPPPHITRVFSYKIPGYPNACNTIVELSSGYLVQPWQESPSSYPCLVFSIHNQGKPPILCKGHTGVILALEALDDKTFASAAVDKTVRVWNAHTGACVHVLKGHERAVSAIKKPNANTLLSASDDTTVREWDVETGDCRHVWRGPDAITHLATLSATTWVSACADCSLMIGPQKQVLKEHSQPISALATHKGTLFSGSYDCTIRAWQAHEKAFVCVATLNKHTGPVNALLVCAPEQLLLSCSNDNTVRMWSLSAPYDCIRVLQQGESLQLFSTLGALAGGYFVAVSETSGATTTGNVNWLSIRSLDNGVQMHCAEMINSVPIVAIKQCASDPKKVFTLHADCSMNEWTFCVP